PASSLRLSFLFSCSSPTPRSTLFPYTTLFRSLLRYLRYRVTRSGVCAGEGARTGVYRSGVEFIFDAQELVVLVHALAAGRGTGLDRKSTRLNSSHVSISYAVFCLKKKHSRYAH